MPADQGHVRRARSPRYWHERFPWTGPSTDDVASSGRRRRGVDGANGVASQPGVARGPRRLPPARVAPRPGVVLALPADRPGPRPLRARRPVRRRPLGRGRALRQAPPRGLPHRGGRPRGGAASLPRPGGRPRRGARGQGGPDVVRRRPRVPRSGQPAFALADAVLSTRSSRLDDARCGRRSGRRSSVRPNPWSGLDGPAQPRLCLGRRRCRTGPSPGGPRRRSVVPPRPAPTPTSSPSRRPSWPAGRAPRLRALGRRGATAPSPWVFYEGPPTANGEPGLHHVWARVYKDLFCRYRTMRGFRVARRAGWDTHGLPVEVEVEKRLGDHRQAPDRRGVGIAEFTRLLPRVGARLRRRLAATHRSASATGSTSTTPTGRSTPTTSQSVWWHLKQLFDQGLLYEDLKVVPYCPRCGTALSSHELGQPDVYQRRGGRVGLRAPAPGRPRPGRRSVRRRRARGLDDHPLDAAVQHRGGRAPRPHLRRGRRAWWWPRSWSTRSSARAPPSPAASRARDLVGLRYRAPLRRRRRRRPEPTAGGWCRGDFVTTEEGTGHRPPGSRPSARSTARSAESHGLPTLNPVGPDGRFTDAVRLAGRASGARGQPRHQRPPGGRGPPAPPAAPPPLLPALLAVRDPAHLLGQAQLVHRHLDAQGRPARGQPGVDWHPAYIRDGRFGEWLANNVDWALSRDRFWGTPLPIWRCGRRPRALRRLPRRALRAGRPRRARHVDPHRPDHRRGGVPVPRLRRVRRAAEAAG